MELEANVRRLAGTLEQEPPAADPREGYVFEFDDDLRLRMFSIPGRPLVLEGPLLDLPADPAGREKLCRKILRVGMARYQAQRGELLIKEDAGEGRGELCYCRQYTPAMAEGIDVVEEVERFLNELALMKGRAAGQESPAPFSPFSFRMP